MAALERTIRSTTGNDTSQVHLPCTDNACAICCLFAAKASAGADFLGPGRCGRRRRAACGRRRRAACGRARGRGGRGNEDVAAGKALPAVSAEAAGHLARTHESLAGALHAGATQSSAADKAGAGTLQTGGCLDGEGAGGEQHQREEEQDGCDGIHFDEVGLSG